MKDPYEKVWNQIVEAFTKQNKMFLWIAERTLSAKDYKEFIEEFTKKKDNHDELIDFIKNKQAVKQDD